MVNNFAIRYADDEEGEGSLQNARIPRRRARTPTFPLSKTARKKPRRWPLVLRFVSGAIHADIAIPVILHALFTTLVVCIHVFLKIDFGLPTTIVPALSIVVGLMLVFRNQSSYQRFWDGRNNLTVVITSVRNLSRSILSCSYKHGEELSEAEEADIERTIKILTAMPNSIKNHLRAEWGAAWAPLHPQDINEVTGAITPRLNPDYAGLLPAALRGHEDEGLGLPIELSCLVEGFIKRGHDRGWFHAPQASQLTVQLNTLVDAYGKMETIRMTPFPVAILIHQRQVLALFGAILPFVIVDESHWWTIPIVSLVMFTLYGIEGIAVQLEDPFGYDRNDIPMDNIVEDARTEINVLLREWRSCNEGTVKKQMFLEEL